MDHGRAPLTKLQLPRLGVGETAGLWLSFQRYALLLALAAAAPLALVTAIAPTAWWAWLIAALISLRLGAWALTIGRRGPAKLHALRVALFRVQRGTFSPEQIRRHCGDPCFRVVARECLRRAGVAGAERRRLVAAYSRELRDDRSDFVIIDHLRGEVRRSVGGEVSITTFTPSTTPPPTTTTLPLQLHADPEGQSP